LGLSPLGNGDFLPFLLAGCPQLAPKFGFSLAEVSNSPEGRLIGRKKKRFLGLVDTFEPNNSRSRRFKLRKRHTQHKYTRPSPKPHFRHTAIEMLEERAMLTVAQDLVNDLKPYQTALNTALNTAASLPLVGKQFKDLQELQSVFQNSLTSIENQTQNLTSGHISLAIPLPSISHTFTFDLGLDAFLQVSTAGGVTASITPTLNVAFDYQNGSVSLDAADTNLDIGFDLTLPNFQATMSLNGLLYTHAVDAGTDFKGDIKFSLGSDSNVDFSGTAHIALGLTVSFVDPSLHASFNPTFNTTLIVNWGFDTQSGQLMTPQVQLQDFSLDADSFLHNFLGDIVTTVQKYTKQLEPFLKTFDTPVPIVSAFGGDETIGDLILDGAHVSQDQQDRFNLMVKVINAVNSIDLSGSTGGAKIDFGTITILGNAEQAGQFNFDTGQLGSAINEILNSPVLQEVKSDLQDLAADAGLISTEGFQFPLLTDPSSVIFGMLTGQTKDMFTFSTGREHFELSAGVGFGIPDVLGIFLNAGMVFDADLSIGYDTAGLIKFIQDSSHNPVDLLHGFYFDNSIDTTDQPVPNVPHPRKTALYLSGSLDLQASAGVTLTGGLFGNIAVELADTDNSNHVHLDDMINNIASKAKVFNFTGKLYAAATISLTLPDPIGPDITLFSYTLGEYDILNYDPPPPPSQKGIPIVVINNPGSHSLLLDISKMAANADVTVQPFEDVSVVDAGQTVTADGIRVDYPNEIDLYVERKNSSTTNYYNFIGLDGAVPDGVQVNITDPFNVFADEGVSDPTPTQTKDGILLAGGKSVLYNYTEDDDGSHPNVLLIGGYGFNTLTGGTAEFGNFVPSNFIARAKSQFGDTSGFDGQAQGFIGTAVDGMALPASPDGITGATMTASRGGLMVGGPGDNSFMAAGPGAFEMDGNSWLDSFYISPSFNGVPATYQIDGGPGGGNNLFVHVPAGDDADFENGTVPDKYDPTSQALDIYSNAGLFATAHGIQNVNVTGEPGASVTLGDTSELNINFKVGGSVHLTFGGSNAPDLFNVSTSSLFYQSKSRYGLPQQTYDNGNYTGLFDDPTYYAAPVYTVSRTFGTNHRTQVISFAINDANSSSLTLDGRGASDTYNLTLGLGAFIDTTISDSDPTTQNNLTVNVRDQILFNNEAVLTDDALQLDYYTRRVFFEFLNDGRDTTTSYITSVHYTPSVFFSANVDITLASAFAFSQTIENRPNAAQTQQATISIDGQYMPDDPFLGPQNLIYDASAENPQLINTTALGTLIDIQANSGSLTFNRSVFPSPALPINIDANSGTITVHTFDTAVSVVGNTGTLNFLDGNNVISGNPDSVIDIGGNLATSSGNLANIHGTINITGETSIGGTPHIIVDDRGGSGNPLDWIIGSDGTQNGDPRTQIGDLTINSSFLWGTSIYEADWRSGTHVTLLPINPSLEIFYNGSSSFPLDWLTNQYIFNTDGDDVSYSLPGNSFGLPSGPITYSVQNLPPGLSLDPSTGLISGTIALQAYLHSPFDVIASITQGNYIVQQSIQWFVQSTISINPPFVPLINETVLIALDPVGIFDSLNRPVTVTVTGLPPGLTFNPQTDVISGTVPAGTSAHGPFDANLHADDGLETVDLPFEIDVTGIQFVPPPSSRLNHSSDAVDFSVPASTTAGTSVTYTATGLPAGITINATTGEIFGTLTANASVQSPYSVNVTFNDGYTTQTVSFPWNILPVGVVDDITFPSLGTQTTVEGDFIDLYNTATSSHFLPLQLTAEDLPPGLVVQGLTILGAPAPGAAENSPYHVTLTATDGIYSAQTTFTWNVTAPVLVKGDLNRDGVVDTRDLNTLMLALANQDSYLSQYNLSKQELTQVGDVNGNGRLDNSDLQALINMLLHPAGSSSPANSVAVASNSTAINSNLVNDSGAPQNSDSHNSDSSALASSINNQGQVATSDASSSSNNTASPDVSVPGSASVNRPDINTQEPAALPNTPVIQQTQNSAPQPFDSVADASPSVTVPTNPVNAIDATSELDSRRQLLIIDVLPDNTLPLSWSMPGQPSYDFAAAPRPILLSSPNPVDDLAASASATETYGSLSLSAVDEAFSKADAPNNPIPWDYFGNFGSHRVDAHFADVEALVSDEA
jgi:hypothetical protein